MTQEQPPRMVGMDGRPAGLRSFTLNSQEFHEAVREPRERPWIPNGALPREPARTRGEASLWVSAECEANAEHAVRSWLAHLPPPSGEVR